MKTMRLLLFCILALWVGAQEAPTRISGPQPPVPMIPPPLPLRPLLSPTNSIRTMTNANGDIVVQTTVVIRRVHDPRKHYYGVIMGEITYLGEWTSADYERWAFAGSQATGNQPELIRWSLIFVTTNQIAVPTVIHVR